MNERYFLATWLPEEIAAELALISADLPDTRPIPAESMHITLSFLGPQNKEAIFNLSQALAEWRFAPFGIQIQGIGQFLAKGRSVVWAGVFSEELLALERRLRRLLHELQMPFEKRRFRPHITLGRPGPVAQERLLDFFNEHGNYSTAFESRGIGLYASHLHPDGARYQEVAFFPAIEIESTMAYTTEEDEAL